MKRFIGSPRLTKTIITLLACLVMAGVSSVNIGAAGDPIEIQVLADRDGGPLNPFFRDFTQGGESEKPEYLDPVWPWFGRLNPRTIRFDHLFDYFTTVERGPDSLEVDFTGLDRMVDMIRETGAEPIMCLSYVPEGLRGESEIHPPDMAEWEELVERTVRHCNVDRRLGIRFWEVWNEPNLVGFWQGTREEYLDLYAASCRGALRADPETKMGGGGFAGFDEGWVVALLDFAKENGLPLDFISWHEYWAPLESVIAHAYRAEGLARERGMEPELIIDEWNVDAGLASVNDDHRAAVYIAEFVRRLQERPVDYAPFFEIKDGWMKDAVFWGRWGMFTSQNTPKANYFCFLFHSRLGEKRVPLVTFDEDVDGLATRDGNDVTFVIYNRSEERKTADILVSGLPEAATGWEWSRFLIDRWHSNPVFGLPARAERVEVVRPLLSRSGAVMRHEALPPHSVSLVELREELWPGGLIVEVTDVASDPGRPSVALFDLTIGNYTGTRTGIVEFEAFTERDDPVRIEVARLPVPLDEGETVFRGEADIPELEEAGEVFFTARARASSGEEAVGSGSIAVTSGVEASFEPVRVSISDTALEATFDLRVRSHRPRKIYANAEWAWEPYTLQPEKVPGYFAIEPYGEAVRSVRFRIPGSAREQNLAVRCSVSAAGGMKDNAEGIAIRSVMIPRLEEPPTIDGRIDEWLDDEPLFSFGGGPDAVEGAPEGDIRIGWDREALYLAVRVVDGELNNTGTGADIWRNDSIQVSFDPEWDARPGSGYAGDDLETGFSLTEKGAQSWVWYNRGSGAPGTYEEAEYAILREGDTTVYEIALPPGALNLPPFEPGMAMGMSVLVNDWDGIQRRSVEWGGGIANQKLPWQFRQVRLGE